LVVTDIPLVLCIGFNEEINGDKVRVMGISRYIEKQLDKKIDHSQPDPCKKEESYLRLKQIVRTTLKRR
jgi:hypothetical protein